MRQVVQGGAQDGLRRHRRADGASPGLWPPSGTRLAPRPADLSDRLSMRYFAHISLDAQALAT